MSSATRLSANDNALLDCAQPLPCIDLKELADRLGNAELAHSIASSFSASFEEQLIDLRRSVAEREFAETARLAHRLKGEAANICAGALAHWADKIEDFATRNEFGSVRECLEELRTAGRMPPKSFPEQTDRLSDLSAIQLLGRSSRTHTTNNRVVIADDDPSTIQILQHTLTGFGYEVAAARDGFEAYNLLKTGRYRLLISDWQMPGMSGLELCRLIRERTAGSYIYVVLLTSAKGVENVVSGLEAGADDFLTKPFHPAELLMRIRTGERIVGLESREMTIFALAKLAESRDQETGEHLERMREYATILARELSLHPDFLDQIDGQYINLIYLTTPLHDIGKVAIPDAILLKPGKLTSDEFELMKTHTTLGAQTLDDVASRHPNAGFLQMARDIALSHHERFDGSGYPAGLAGNDIPLCGRITAVADVYDALTSRRVYKDAFDHETAEKIITDGSGTQFDPRVVDAFLECRTEFLAVRQRNGQFPASS